jgi:beta-galactosidase
MTLRKYVLGAVTLALLAYGGAVVPAHAAVVQRFPRGFLWGTAISGFQTEMGQGRNLDRGSDWWVWVHDAANVAAHRVSGDEPEHGPGHYALFRSDIGLARNQLHNNAIRISIEWSRVFPRSTAAVSGPLDLAEMKRLDKLADQRAVRHYRDELLAIRRTGMTAFVTVEHFTLPLWIDAPIATSHALARLGPNDPPPSALARAGWLSRSIVPEFAKYSAYLAWKYGKLVDFWTPINEPVVVAASGYVNIPGVFADYFPPGVLNYPAAIRALVNLVHANAASYDAIHKWDPHARVGLTQFMLAFTPTNPSSAADVTATKHANYLFNTWFLNAVVKGVIDANGNGIIDPGEHHQKLAGKADFLGIDYYYRGRVSALDSPLSPAIPVLDFLPATSYRTPQNPSAPPCPTTCSDFGNEIYPQGLMQVLRIAGGYHRPVYITENGIADARDRLRPSYTVRQLLVLRDAIKHHVADVRGFFEWSLVDNFEWGAGYAEKFGLYSYNPRTLRRTARPSAHEYGQIAQANGLPASLLQRFGG